MQLATLAWVTAHTEHPGFVVRRYHWTGPEFTLHVTA